MKVIRSIAQMTAFVKRRRLGFVPTMGFLHKGHLSLVRQAKRENKTVVVSIFVNPTQFGPFEDFESYPRKEKSDLTLLKKAGVDAVFMPSVSDVYPNGPVSTIKAGPICKPLEGVFRKGHFDGVVTVLKRLFDIVQPAKAYFGQKDYQQTLVVKDMVRRLHLPVKIVVCPTMREIDGLAKSSRNIYLSAQQRVLAPVLYQTLRQASAEVKTSRNPRQVEKIAATVLTLAGFEVQYVAVADAKSLKPATAKTKKRVILAAAYLGKTRLIDRVAV